MSRESKVRDGLSRLVDRGAIDSYFLMPEGWIIQGKFWPVPARTWTTHQVEGMLALAEVFYYLEGEA